MSKKQVIEDFIDQKKLAIVGVSRSGNKFGNIAYKELKQKGYQVFAVHPEAETVAGDKAYPDFKSLPEAVDGVVLVVPPQQTEKVIRDAAEAGIKRVWMQQGAESDEAIRFCEEKGISVVSQECVMMYARPVKFPHSLHRWVWGLMGKME
ncbi:MAG: CoA-binding protein [Anaerolineales bacterium]|nr:CoA-binding protein [Anaerolineales bacterium]